MPGPHAMTTATKMVVKSRTSFYNTAHYHVLKCYKFSCFVFQRIIRQNLILLICYPLGGVSMIRMTKKKKKKKKNTLNKSALKCL